MKKLFRTIYILPVLLFLTLGLNGCGGGGGGGGGSTAPTTSQGKFIDAAVEGITYTSGSITGTTTADGTFEYEPGQTVTFSIGGITLGTIGGSATITPVQLVSGASDETDSRVINIVQFLLSIDDDNDPDNGIKITPAMTEAAVGLSLPSLSSPSFDTDAISVINTIKDAAPTAGYIGVYDEVLAEEHLKNSLFSILAGTYSGNYIGDDTGDWTVTVAADGSVSGSGTTNFDGSVFSIAGSVNTSGTVSASASGSAGTASWAGIVTITSGAFSGSWSGSGENGTFNGNKK